MNDLNFPYRFDSRGRTALTTTSDHVRDMIELLIFTNPGERVNRPDFGSGVLQLVFAPNSPELAAALQFTMQAALQRWLGDLIELETLVVESQDSMLTVTIHYRLQTDDAVRVAQFTRTV